MGNRQSQHIHATNDFELAIKSAKELEYILETEFGGTGKGLHEKISSASPALSDKLVKRMRYLATIRNKLVHERGFDYIPDRPSFISAFEESVKDLNQILEARGRPAQQSCVIC